MKWMIKTIFNPGFSFNRNFPTIRECIAGGELEAIDQMLRDSELTGGNYDSDENVLDYRLSNDITLSNGDDTLILGDQDGYIEICIKWEDNKWLLYTSHDNIQQEIIDVVENVLIEKFSFGKSTDWVERKITGDDIAVDDLLYQICKHFGDFYTPCSLDLETYKEED
jgi:hypothetical protein